MINGLVISDQYDFNKFVGSEIFCWVERKLDNYTYVQLICMVDLSPWYSLKFTTNGIYVRHGFGKAQRLHFREYKKIISEINKKINKNLSLQKYFILDLRPQTKFIS